MGSVFVQVQVEDATVESLSAALLQENVSSTLERSLRQALDIPAEKSVVIEPFRNGVVLNVATAQTVENALEEMTGGMETYEGEETTEDERWAREALAYVRAGLAVIQGSGG